MHENIRISIKISLKFVPNVPISIIPALVQIMAWRRPGDKPLSEPIMVRLPTHKCITQPKSFKSRWMCTCNWYHFSIFKHQTLFRFWQFPEITTMSVILRPLQISVAQTDKTSHFGLKTVHISTIILKPGCIIRKQCRIVCVVYRN